VHSRAFAVEILRDPIRVHSRQFAVGIVLEPIRADSRQFAVTILRGRWRPRKKDRGKALDESILAPASGGLFTAPRSLEPFCSTDPADIDRWK